jgi:hypothetical protein
MDLFFMIGLLIRTLEYIIDDTTTDISTLRQVMLICTLVNALYIYRKVVSFERWIGIVQYIGKKLL